MTDYFRPLVETGPARPDHALTLAGGWGWFSQVEHLTRDGAAKVLPMDALPEPWRARLCTPRPAIAGLSLDAPRLMGIVNVTPDSFSDGGLHTDPDRALAHAESLVSKGADIIDIGGESTRPGAAEIDVETEIARALPVIRAMRAQNVPAPISIDTRKAAVARAVGADLINDVSGFTFDPALGALAAETGSPVCVMHSQGEPATMQANPTYDDVLYDVYDWLEERITALEAQGIPRTRILADPGIGFGKSFEHNMTLLKRLSLFHGLGTGLLLGVSRKGFIGRIGNAPDATARAPGSIAVALHALDQGVQMIRAHDISEHAQAIALWRACKT